MKTILKRGIATSVLLLCLSLSIFAEGDMETGSLTGNNGGGLATTINTQIETNNKKSEQETLNFIDWILIQFDATFGSKV